MGKHYERHVSVRFGSYDSEPAEDAFEAWAPTQDIRWQTWGLHRPPFTYVTQLARKVRSAPDYIAELGGERRAHLLDKRGNKARHVLVECKGCGRDQTIKMKEDALMDLAEWQSFTGHPVAFFLYDMANDRVSADLLSLEQVTRRCIDAETARFPDNNRLYYKLTTDQFDWTAAPPKGGHDA